MANRNASNATTGNKGKAKTTTPAKGKAKAKTGKGGGTPGNKAKTTTGTPRGKVHQIAKISGEFLVQQGICYKDGESVPLNHSLLRFVADSFAQKGSELHKDILASDPKRLTLTVSTTGISVKV